MAYDEVLAGRIQVVMEEMPGVVAKKMFGGVGFLLNGNMACGVNKNNLIVRVGPDGYDKALAEPHTSVFDMTGRPMTGWVVVSTEGCELDSDLKRWVNKGIAFAESLPPK